MIGERQRRLRRWMRRHGWHTANTPTGQGFYAESPTENCAGGLYLGDHGAGAKRYFCWERFLGVELDRINCDYVTFSIFKRRHWWQRGTVREWEPSDEFDEWKRNPDAAVNIPARDVVKLAEMILAAQEDWNQGRPSKHHLTYMELIAKRCPIRWIGVNSSYEEIKRVYGNKRKEDKHT